MFPDMVYTSSDAASKRIASAKTERVRKPSEVSSSTKAMDSKSDPGQKHAQGNYSHITAAAQQHVGHQQHIGLRGKGVASYWPEDATEPLGGKNKSAAQVVCIAADTDLDGTLSDINSISGSSSNPPTSSGTSTGRCFFLRLKQYLQKLEKKCDKFHYWDRRWKCAV